MADDPTSWPRRWFNPERHDLLTPLNVRALAHPIRMNLLEILRQDGPATASGLGQRISQSSGVTSYHLRVMAEAGLVVEDETLGNKRDRWWRAAHEGTTFSFRVPGQQGSPEQLEDAEHYLRMVARADYERVLSYVGTVSTRMDELVELPWHLGHVAVSLTYAEARELGAKIYELVADYSRDRAGEARGRGGPDEHGPGRHSAVLQFQLVPEPHGPGPHP